MEGIEEIILVFVVATFSYSAETDELKKKKEKRFRYNNGLLVCKERGAYKISFSLK